VVYVIAAGHLLAAAFAFFHGGPFSHGREWGLLWLGMAVLMPLIMASLVPTGEYGASPACVQACGYPAPPLVFFAFYPWAGPHATGLRHRAELLVVAALCVEPLLLMFYINGYLTQDNRLAFVASAIPYLGAFLLGKALENVCRNAARGQLDWLQKSYQQSLAFMHGRVDAGIGMARDHYAKGEAAEVLKTLQWLDAEILEERRRLMRADEYLVVAKSLDWHIRRYGDRLLFAETPQVGALTVPHEVGRLFDDALADLLKNVLWHVGAGATVWLSCAVSSGVLRLNVRDSGTGIPPNALHRPGGNLSGLRDRAVELGGDLTVAGSSIELTVPLHGKD
jgi:hypothetical protein